MSDYILTAGDLRKSVAHLGDDEPIEFFLNDVETRVYKQAPGVEGGDAASFVVEPNYTCPSPA